MAMLERKGGCLCGAIRFSFTPAESEIYACHCTMCRRWGGGPGLSIKAAAPADIERAEHLAVYASSEWGQRQFCRTCGTHLFFAAPGVGYFGVSAGTLDDLSGLALTTEIFIDHKPGLYDFANATEQLTEAQFLALVAADGAKETE
jgi:hypothetical protein